LFAHLVNTSDYDLKSSRSHFVALNQNVECIVRMIFMHFGLPKSIMSDDIQILSS